MNKMCVLILDVSYRIATTTKTATKQKCLNSQTWDSVVAYFLGIFFLNKIYTLLYYVALFVSALILANYTLKQFN